MSKLDSIKLANYSRGEDWFNSITHMVGGGLAVIALVLCLIKSIIIGRIDYIIVSIIYGISMIGTYSCSSVYHALKPNRGKKAMRMVDHAMIFPMIAGTITPLAVLGIIPINKTLGLIILIVAWVAVAVGIPLTFTTFNKTKGLRMTLYLAMGWMVLISFKTLTEFLPTAAIALLIAGGVAYTLGAIIYGIGSKRKYFHGIFHLFVILGSILHFVVIYGYGLK